MTRPAPPPVLVLDPWLRDLVWGGHALHTRYGLGRADQPAAEAWALADRAEGAARVVWPPGIGTLTDAIDAWGRALAGARGLTPTKRLPLLVKLLDAAQALSVQVHPGRAHLRDPRLLRAESKEECWLVLAAAPGARLWLGVREDVDEAAFGAALAAGLVGDLLDEHEPRVGDVIHVTPGTLHAIGAGLVLAEVQESSDTTYRVWDWGRVGADGRPRDLHLEQALAVTDWSRRAVDCVVRRGTGALPAADQPLLDTAAFRVDWRWGPIHLDAEPDQWVAYLLLAGEEAALEAPKGPLPCRPGHVVLLPAGAAPLCVLAPRGRGWLRVGPPAPAEAGRPAHRDNDT